MFPEKSQPLHPDHPVLSKARLYPSFLEDGSNFACVLVLPGGGYGMVSHQEGPPLPDGSTPSVSPLRCSNTPLPKGTRSTHNCVPVENSYLMAIALKKQAIPHELHVFPKGAHGLGLCTIDDRRNPSAAQWTTLARNWLHGLGF